MKTLFEMTEQEARRLGSQYLQRLITANIKIMNTVQKTVYNGLFFYAECLYWQEKYATVGDPMKTFAKEQCIADAPLVRECHPVVDAWLAADMPLDFQPTQDTYKMFNNDKYGQLLAEFKPKAIHSEDQNEHYLTIVESLMLLGDNITPEQEALMDLLTTLIEVFEEREYGNDE